MVSLLMFLALISQCVGVYADTGQPVRIGIPSNNQQPFIMANPFPQSDELKDKYEGYLLELIEDVTEAANLDFTFNVIAGNSYDDLLQLLADDKIDLAVGDITMNEERAEQYGFSVPFMTVGITIIMKKPSTRDSAPFSFLQPFSSHIWLYTLGAYITVSCLLAAVSRFTEVESFSIFYAFWFNIAAFLGQGVERLPRSYSARLITVSWWVFILLMVSAYTANLAAYLTVDKMENKINSAKDLVEQEDIMYGTVIGGSTFNFLKNSKNEIYKKMGQYFTKHKDLTTKSNGNGLERVRKGGYAFIMESPQIEFEIANDCNLKQVGGMLKEAFYAIGMQKNSSYKSAIDQAILKLQSDGSLALLKDKWWKKMESCEAPAIDGLQLKNIGGTFLILMVGLAAAIGLALVEWWWKGRKSD